AGSTPTARSNASSGWLDAQVPSDARVKPPWNHPHVTPAAVSRSPTFRPVSAAVRPREQTSQYGSVSSTRVPGRSPAGACVAVDEAGPPHSGTSPYTARGGPQDAPWESPATRLSAPRVDWPAMVAKLLSLMAKCWAYVQYAVTVLPSR